MYWWWYTRRKKERKGLGGPLQKDVLISCIDISIWNSKCKDKLSNKRESMELEEIVNTEMKPPPHPRFTTKSSKLVIILLYSIIIISTIIVYI